MSVKINVAQEAVSTIPMLALRGLVLFPSNILHFDVARKKSIAAVNKAVAEDRPIFLVAQKDVKDDDPNVNEIYNVGVIASVRQVLKVAPDNIRVLVEGVSRAAIEEVERTEPYLEARVVSLEDTVPKSGEKMLQALVRKVKDLFNEYAMMFPRISQEIVMEVMSCETPGYLADYIASNIMLRYEDKQLILEELNPLNRLKKLAAILENENDILDLELKINEKVKSQIDKNQREYYLREQMRAISQELGETDNPSDEAAEYQDKILAAKLPEKVEEKLLKEVDKLYKMPSSSHEATVVRNYLDACLELPWNVFTKDKIDLKRVRQVLDRDHFGLDKIKERMVEYLAVRKLAPDIKGQILCLVGPPGVGKTSIAHSIAEAMGRKYVRISLGGIHDEADIRGHRKTYIGAMPGRIIDAIRQAGSSNPLMLLDEVDKVGNDNRGDPSSALLEVMDSEQNNTFRDHYLEIPYDLSNVMFITTANNPDTIPQPLYDRMEIINLGSYTREEKFHIAKKHLLPKQVKRHGLSSKTIKVSDGAIYDVIDFYTREAGVRTLERTIAALCRKTAKLIVSEEKTKNVITGDQLEKFLGPRKFKPETPNAVNEIGVATGLAWTSVGGETMPIEVAVLDGSGKIELTGSLGEVMKESAKAAVTCVRSRAHEYGIDEEFYKKKDIHIHVPEGAVPKDGPSAGITIATAVLSALANIPVKRDVAMTGEITLRGRVLPIGGLKEKMMAAYRLGIKTVIIPKQNEPDLAEVDQIVKDHISFVTAETFETVYKTALCEKYSTVIPAVPEAVTALKSTTVNRICQ